MALVKRSVPQGDQWQVDGLEDPEREQWVPRFGGERAKRATPPKQHTSLSLPGGRPRRTHLGLEGRDFARENQWCDEGAPPQRAPYKHQSLKTTQPPAYPHRRPRSKERVTHDGTHLGGRPSSIRGTKSSTVPAAQAGRSCTRSNRGETDSESASFPQFRQALDFCDSTLVSEMAYALGTRSLRGNVSHAAQVLSHCD